MSQRNKFLDHDAADESAGESGSGYDSEAAERSRTERRGVKRRKLSHSSASGSEDADSDVDTARNVPIKKVRAVRNNIATSQEQAETDRNGTEPAETTKDVPGDEQGQELLYATKEPKSRQKSSKTEKKQKTPGVIYLSSLPPYLKPSALRNLLAQRGFEPITRLFLTPVSKHKHSSKKSSRQLYAEGWIEFASKKTAKHCAEALNAQPVGGKKGGFYYDDLWNMKYLRGMSWEELMSGITAERREEEGRRDEERRRIAHETETFVRGVERAKQVDGIKRKRQKQDKDLDGSESQHVWRQHEVAKSRKGRDKGASDFEPQVQQVLSQIF